MVLAVQGGVIHGNLSVRPVGHPREFRVVGQLVIVFGTAELLPVVGYRFMAPRTHFRPSAIRIVGDEQVRCGLEFVVHMVFFEFLFPWPVILHSGPERIVGREEQAQERLSAPVYAAPATVNLYGRCEGAVESQRRHIVFQKIGVLQKLQQSGGSDAAHPSVIDVRVFFIS